MLTTPLTTDEEKKLWKTMWGKNINMSEHTKFMNYKDRIHHAKWTSIKNYATGDFHLANMEEFLGEIKTFLIEPFIPDQNVIRSNRENYTTILRLSAKEINYEPTTKPAQKKRPLAHNQAPGKDRGRGSDGRGRGRGQQVPSLYQGKNPIPSHLWCSNPFCREKGQRVYSSHTVRNCTNKNRTVPDTGKQAMPSARSHNTPKGHSKGKGKSRNGYQNNRTGKGKSKGNSRPVCKICHSYHDGPCPIVEARKARKTTINGRVNNSPGLKSKLKQYFTTAEAQEIAERILYTYDQPGTCQDCLHPECDGYCRYHGHYDSSYFNQVHEVKNTIAENFNDIGHAMRLAVHEEDNCPDRAVMAPVNAESFFTYSHNGDDYQEEEQSSSGIFDEPNPNEEWNQDKAEYREEDPPLSLLNDTTT
jgi:hypothetical protein